MDYILITDFFNCIFNSRLTIVRKIDAGDGSYPSVNTCVHYLKVNFMYRIGIAIDSPLHLAIAVSVIVNTPIMCSKYLI